MLPRHEDLKVPEARSWRASKVKTKIVDSLLDIMAAIGGSGVGERDMIKFVF